MEVTAKMGGIVADGLGAGNFHLAMLDKLRKKRVDGRGGWNDPEVCSTDDLRKMLVDHLHEGYGDMVDIGNFAMMIWNREQMEKLP